MSQQSVSPTKAQPSRTSWATTLEKVEAPLWVGSTHCRLAASGTLDSSDRFPAMCLGSRLTQPAPELPLKSVKSR